MRTKAQIVRFATEIEMTLEDYADLDQSEVIGELVEIVRRDAELTTQELELLNDILSDRGLI